MPTSSGWATVRPSATPCETPPAGAHALFVEVVNFVQSREVLTATPRSLLTMTMRPEAQIGPVEQTSIMVREDRIAFVEILHASKGVCRASPELVVYDGNHSPEVEGGVDTDGILCLHVPLRARSAFTHKVDQGRRRVEEGVPPESSWHVRRWWEMAQENTLDREWAANSYEDGALVLAGRRRPLVPDDRLREAVAPHVPVDDGAPEEPTPPVGAYLWAMDTVPGTLEEPDFWLFVELDRIQRASGLTGCMVELGRADARSAVLLGHLVRPPEERFVIVDADGDDGINQEFAAQYARFPAHAPEVRSGSSATRGHTPDIDDLIHARRIVHLNGGGADDSVSRDLLTARNLLSPGGVVAVSDAPAAWGVVLAEGSSRSSSATRRSTGCCDPRLQRGPTPSRNGLALSRECRPRRSRWVDGPSCAYGRSHAPMSLRTIWCASRLWKSSRSVRKTLNWGGSRTPPLHAPAAGPAL
jgi:hypothetical protein